MLLQLSSVRTGILCGDRGAELAARVQSVKVLLCSCQELAKRESERGREREMNKKKKIKEQEERQRRRGREEEEREGERE